MEHASCCRTNRKAEAALGCNGIAVVLRTKKYGFIGSCFYWRMEFTSASMCIKVLKKVDDFWDGF